MRGEGKGERDEKVGQSWLVDCKHVDGWLDE